MATASITPPVEREVTLVLSETEARWLSAVARHVNYTGPGRGVDLEIWTVLHDAGISVSTRDEEEILRTYETDPGIFLGEYE